ncbi:MAG: hypothetical protein MG2_0835 [uncultured Candidatus Poseidoniales archaeon]|nr:MAG: hypothetical protein MG2_0835 [uncultured Candidatus Poseidoniales archaeon]
MALLPMECEKIHVLPKSTLVKNRLLFSPEVNLLQLQTKR